MGTIGRFFAGIGALVRRPSDGKYLLLRRTEGKDFAGGGWESVTGRVDQGESFTDAVLREVCEELGVSARIDFILGTMHFYRGDARPENELVGVHFCCSVDDAEGITLDWEHSEQRWVTAREAGALLPEGHWLARLVERAEVVRALLPPELVAYYREQSPEI